MTGKNPSLSLPTFGDDSVDSRRLVQTYKLVNGNSWSDLEGRVNYFLQQPGNEGYQVHGDIQMYSGNEFVQSLVGYKYI